MVGILFGMIVLFEVVFTISCIHNSSCQQVFRSYTRIVALGIFLCLCSLSVVQWGIRWYWFATGLFVLALLGGYVLLVSRKKKKKYKKSKMIWKAIGMSILFAVLLIPVAIFPQIQMPLPTGDYEVLTKEDTFTSEYIIDEFTGNKRQVNVAFWYPQSEGKKFPLVVFSHGAFGIKNSNLSAYEELASHGYVVCSIDHPGHSFYTKSKTGDTVLVNKSYLKEVMLINSNSEGKNLEFYNLIRKWMKLRTDDINLVLDTIEHYSENEDKIENLQPSQTKITGVYALVDCEKIGVFGHSMGAAASVEIGGLREDVDAVINIDGPYFSELCYDPNRDEIIASGKPYTTPILDIYSDQVWVQLQDGKDIGVYAGNKISDQICKENYRVYLRGTKHLTLTDLSYTSPFLTNVLNGTRANVDCLQSIQLENKLILEFFNAKLKGNGNFHPNGVYDLKKK